MQLAARNTDRPFSRIEWAGWAVVAGDVLRLNCGDAAILRDLVLSAGRFISVDRLAATGGRAGTDPDSFAHPRFRIAVRVARIRNALDDIGVPRRAIQNDTEAGYAFAPTHALRVRGIVEGGA